MQTFFSHIECSACGTRFSTDELLNLCPQCQKPLLARYDLDAARKHFSRDHIDRQERSLWRYAPMLPVKNPKFRFSLGEGFTPLLSVPSWAESIGHGTIFVKDESANPTLSFKARGLVMAVSRAAELGVTKIAIPSAGNAAGATAAYCARAGIEC
ncbi:MAG: pyridoxal-phosphate dependent enzyme, partial [candidate division KSB1 bacterium]|nr:pyridoxal-phosphate dependent enzyme [candidate division KSB1 bacterium]